MFFKLLVAVSMCLLIIVVMPRLTPKPQIHAAYSFTFYVLYMFLLFKENMLGILGLICLTILLIWLGHRKSILEASLIAVSLYFMLTFLNYLTAFRQLLVKGVYLGGRIPYYFVTWNDWIVFICYTILAVFSYRILVNSVKRKVGSLKTGHLLILLVDGLILLITLVGLNYLYRFLGRSIEGIHYIKGLSGLLLSAVHAMVIAVLLLIYLMNSYWITHFNFKAFKNVADLDELTGILNRQSGLRKLADIYRQSRQSGNDFVICFVDVNNLKVVNDRYGHHEGDRMIKAIATCLDSSLRDGDYVCRLGGDEFLICFSKCVLADAQKAWTRIGSELDRINFSDDFQYRISVSHGLVAYLENRKLTLKELIEKADAMMYEQKKRFKQNINTL